MGNNATHLKLHRARFISENAAAVEQTFDILAFEVTYGVATPITVLGPALDTDWYYAVVNTLDKSYTLLDGTFYPSYREFIGAAFEVWRAKTAATDKQRAIDRSWGSQESTPVKEPIKGLATPHSAVVAKKESDAEFYKARREGTGSGEV